MKKKRTLVIVSILLVLSSVSIFAGGQEEAVPAEVEPVVLDVWIQSVHSQESSIVPLAEAFKKTWQEWDSEHPEIRINFSLLPKKSALNEKLFAAAKAGLRPDLVQMPPEWGPALVKLGFIQPIDDLIDKAYVRDFLKVSIDYNTIGGKLYALPFFVGPNSYIYRKSHLAEYGIEPPNTWQDLFDLGKKAKNVGRWGYFFPGIPGDYSFPVLANIVWGLGGEFVNKKGEPVFFESRNAEKLKQAYGFYNDVVNTYQISPVDCLTFDDRGMFTGIFADEVSTWSTALAYVSMYATTRPDLLADLEESRFPMPKGTNPSSFVTQWNYAIATQDPEKQQAAAILLKKLTSKEHLLRYCPSIWSVMPRISVMSEVLPPAMQVSIFLKSFELVKNQGRAAPLVEYFPRLQESVTRGISEIVLGEKNADQIIEDAKEQVLAEIE